MKNSIISTDNKLQNILDFDVCKKMVIAARKKNEQMVILCPHYSINVQSKFEDGEQLDFDLDELNAYIDEFVEVNDYDDLVVYLDYEQQEDDEGIDDTPSLDMNLYY